jgi:beta-N-acetylhexosaminidase
MKKLLQNENSNLDIHIGQMLMVGFEGLELTENNPIVQDIRERHIGGVILFDYDISSQAPLRNIQNPRQAKTLCAALQKMASIPLFIAIDQEGGKVSRLKEGYGFPPTVSQQRLGTINRLDITREHAEITARTLAQIGINLNFAPVVDLNTNPDNPVIGKLERSFSCDPNLVTCHALEMIKAHHRHGIPCTLKHFPGHGSSTRDSHLGFVDVTETWSSIELEPYARIIETGQCDAVMTAHIFNAHLDPEFPATLSRSIITRILRANLGYDRVVVSDDMQMKAISDHYGLEKAVYQAIEAGVDILLFGNNVVFEEDIVLRTVAIIKDLIKRGKISRDRINRSYERISRLKSFMRRNHRTAS